MNFLQRAGQREQNVVFDVRERVMAAFERVVPCVVEVQCRAMVNQPEASVPHQNVRVAGRAVYVGNIGIKPYDGRRQL